MKMHVPIGKPQPWVLPVTLVCLAFGGFVAALMGAVASDSLDIDTSTMNREQLSVLYSKSVQESKAQQKEIGELRAKVNDMTDGAVSEQAAIHQQLDDLRVRAGSTPVKGQGIFIFIDDTGNIKNSPVDPNTNLRVVHDSDLLTLVNELRSAGAEAIDINGLRVVGTTAIRCAGPVIQVNGTAVAPPFRITAIGKSDTLYGAVNMPNGVFDWLRPLGIRVEVSKRANLLVPAVKVLAKMEFAKPVLDDKAGGTEQ